MIVREKNMLGKKSLLPNQAPLQSNTKNLASCRQAVSSKSKIGMKSNRG